MKNILIIFFILITFISCIDKNKKNQEYFEKENDTLSKIYYNNSNLKLKEIFTKDNIIKKFYSNGNVFSEGRLNEKNQRIGNWKFYTKEGFLSEIREYRIIKDELYLNQNIYFSKEDADYWIEIKDENFNYYEQSEFYADTLMNNNSYYTQFDLGKDTIGRNEPWRAVAFYYTPVYKDNSSKVIVILGDFNEDFSNVTKVKQDTFFCLTNDIENQKWFPNDDPQTTVAFGRWFETTGRKIIRGYLSEFYIDKKQKHHERRTYFEKEVFVKDSI